MMNRLATAAVSLAILSTASAWAAMEITPNGARPSTKGAPQNFTGSVVVTPLFAAMPERRTSGGHVSFEPGTRSAWHTHPGGQILIVTAGVGWVQESGGEKREI